MSQTPKQIANHIVANNFLLHELEDAIIVAITAERQLLSCGHSASCIVGNEDDPHCGWCADMVELDGVLAMKRT